MCAEHWAKLRAEVKARGLDALVAEGGEAAAKNLVSELSEGTTLDNFDPLMGAHNALLSNAMSVAGGHAVEMLQAKEDGTEWCPVCFLNERNPWGHDYDEWLGRAADDMVEVWKGLKP